MKGRESWPRLLGGLLIVFALFQWLGGALESDRGQAGLLIGALVVTATLAVERVFFARPFADAARALGLGRPAARGILTAVALSLALALVLPLSARITQTSIALQTGWAWLVLGLFAQAGLAEEILFRGFLFGHLRRRRTFWRAAVLAALPFAAVHLILFATLPWTIALAALVLAVAMSFPLAHLFELGGGTIWPPALLHFVVQGAIKVVAIFGESAALIPLIWIAASGLIPLLVFFVPRESEERETSVL